MTLARNTMLAALASLALAAPAVANDTYRPYRHLENVAEDLRSDARGLVREFALHFRHTPEYAHLRSDGLEMYRLADHIEEVADDRGSVIHLQRDLAELDRLFHHTEGLLRQITIRAQQGAGGHIHGDLRHVARDMQEMAQNLHHLREDVEQLVRASQSCPWGHGVNPGYVVPGRNRHVVPGGITRPIPGGINHGVPGVHINTPTFRYNQGCGGTYIGGIGWGVRIGH